MCGFEQLLRDIDALSKCKFNFVTKIRLAVSVAYIFLGGLTENDSHFCDEDGI